MSASPRPIWHFPHAARLRKAVEVRRYYEAAFMRRSYRIERRSGPNSGRNFSGIVFVCLECGHEIAVIEFSRNLSESGNPRTQAAAAMKLHQKQEHAR
jgi:hypothetical protein